MSRCACVCSQPALGVALKAVDAATPVVMKARAALSTVWVVLQPYHPEEWTPIFIGLIMLYCGGADRPVVARVVVITPA